ncbi:MAG: histidine--tRNA ligase [Campylobacteraceae bacterium]|jgi:histidyl-tRNA synthetase|nr:histidine--tRNA ligase [Campylobacteraceae bacterium]
MITALRGMKDIHFEDAKKFEKFLDIAVDTAKKHGFSMIETPILEETGLFLRSVGESSDIVGKEMYRFTDKGENDVCMRPEGTAGVVRAFVEKKLDRTGGEYRFYYFGPMYRYERPQKGRLRQFHQFGIESFGESSYLEDASLINMAAMIFDRLGIKYSLKLNSLGCDKCVPTYKKELVERLTEISAELCEDCQRRINTNPMRVFDCKNESCQQKLFSLPRITDVLCEECESDFDGVKAALNKIGITYEVDKNLVRGLDYYTKTAFEFISTEIGAQSSIAGGGRYDKLVESLDGRATPAVGFAIGIERISDLITIDEEKRGGVYIAPLCEEAVLYAFDLSKRLRQESVTYLGYSAKSPKNHLKAADKQNALWFVGIGEKELQEGSVWLKNLETKEECSLSVAELKSKIQGNVK